MADTHYLQLPNYFTFTDTLSGLALPISASELHGVMCGYLCAGAIHDGETYLRALLATKKKLPRQVASALFEIYAVSQQQLTDMNFEFQLLLPTEEAPLIQRAQAFSEWCEGFTQGMTMAGIGYPELEDEEAQEALQHIAEFAQLDYQSLEVEDQDERALMEVSEYTRMAVLRIHHDLQAGNPGKAAEKTTH